MNESVKAKTNLPFKQIIRDEVTAIATVSAQGRAELVGIVDKLPLSYSNVPAIFRSLEAKTPGAGGLFSIFRQRPLQGLRRMRPGVRRPRRAPHDARN
jgi:hypothetical protein